MRDKSGKLRCKISINIARSTQNNPYAKFENFRKTCANAVKVSTRYVAPLVN